MKKCDIYQSWIWLSHYDELTSDQQAELTSHLKTCHACRLQEKEAERVFGLLNRKVRIQPTEFEMNANRQRLHRQLLSQASSKMGWKRIFSFEFRPILQFAAGTAIFGMGLILGHFFFGSGAKVDRSAIASRNVMDRVQVESVQFHPESKKVTITYQSLGDNRMTGDLDKPEIQQMLANMLVNDDRPNMRLKTVDAISKIHSFEESLLNALTEVLQNDDNPGVRLKAARILNSIPMNSQFVNILIRVFTRVLLIEENSAIRNEAINGLGRIGNAETDPLLYDMAKTDTSDYVRYKASQQLNRMKLERTE